MTSSETCASCLRPKGTLKCEICQEALCKNCVRFLDPSSFSFRTKVAEELKHDRYCPNCYDMKVEPELQSYEEVMERARGLYVFFTTQRRMPPILKKSKQSLRVPECEDRDEAILKLAFMAAEQGFNALIEVEVVSKKTRNGGHEKTFWAGSGLPAEVDVEKLERDS